jgi:hypothetical protein
MKVNTKAKKKHTVSKKILEARALSTFIAHLQQSAIKPRKYT